MSTPPITLDDPIEPRPPPPVMRQRQWRSAAGAPRMRQWRSRIGLGIFVLMVLIALFGPLIAPHSADRVRRRPEQPGRRARRCSAPTTSAATCGAASSTAGGPCSACRWRPRSSASAWGSCVGLTAAYCRRMRWTRCSCASPTCSWPSRRSCWRCCCWRRSARAWPLIVVDRRDLARAARGPGDPGRRAAGGRARLRQSRRGRRRAAPADHLRRAAAQRHQPAAGGGRACG